MTNQKLSRPELILLLLYQPGATGNLGEQVVGRTRLMKLLFLLSQEEKIDSFLSEKQQFVPFRYGPYDADVYDDLEALEELNLVKVSGPSTESRGDERDNVAEDDVYDVNTRYELTPLGESKAKELLTTAPKDVVKRITNVKTTFGTMPLVELLHYVYRKYEDYASASEIKGKVLDR